MKIRWSIHCLVLVCFLVCCKVHEDEPSGIIARFGTTPTIDGVFDDGEWDDAKIVQVGKYQQFRIKHDSINLYYALIGDGGNFYFNKDKSIQVLHASAQLWWAEYTKSETSDTQSLDKTFDPQLYNLQNELADEINKKMADYLTENGWVGSIGGNKAQTEFAVSFNLLGVSFGSRQFVKTPSHYVYSGRHIAPEEIEKFLALSLEERKAQYPTLYWPEEPAPNDSLNAGYCPEFISIDSENWDIIWIDLGRRAAEKQ